MSLTLKERQILREYLERQERKTEIKRQQAIGKLSFFEAQRQRRALATANHQQG